MAQLTKAKASSSNMLCRREALVQLLTCYEKLAADNQHLLQALINGAAVEQWQHLPEDDAIDSSSGYQWFYHCHAPEDRGALDASEHGHFHLFARGPSLAALPKQLRTQDCLRPIYGASIEPSTRHLLCVALNAKGVPIEIFTVNGWVTGDAMVDAEASAWLLQNMELSTGYEAIDIVLKNIVALFATEIDEVLISRDHFLLENLAVSHAVLADQTIEILSSRKIDIDHCLRLL